LDLHQKTIMRFALLITFVLLFAALKSYAQEDASLLDKIANFPNKLFSKAQNRAADLQRQLDKQTEKYLNDLAKKEARLKKKLYKTDSAKASALFANNPEQQYASFVQKLRNDSSTVVRSMGPEYLPYADSLHGALSFFSKNPQLLSNPALSGQAGAALIQVSQLESKLQIADQIKQYIQQRRDQIRQCLSGEATMPPGASGIYNEYNKQLYYYSQQVRQYREVLNDPDKMMSTALSLLNKLPAFADFMKNNSFLAGLFGIPANYGTAAGLDGLQTRDQVLAMIQNQIGSGGPNAASALSSSLQTAQADITKLQNKLNNLGGGSGDMDVPNFKPQQTKTKDFFQRLEYGTNMQTAHAAYYFPTTTDLGLSVGYKISDKSTVGIGASYKIGWGTDYRHISMSSQGASLRSYADVQAKKSFYATGGFEYNYQPVPGIDIGSPSSWTKSGLIGMSKIVSMKTKVFKSTKLSLLWDFLSYQQVPRTQPLVFRVGYSF
jgi:hypothetical protein